MSQTTSFTNIYRPIKLFLDAHWRFWMPKKRVMTPQEVAAYINSQTNWSDENKRAVLNLYHSYLGTITIPPPKGSNLAKLAKTWRKQ